VSVLLMVMAHGSQCVGSSMGVLPGHMFPRQPHKEGSCYWPASDMSPARPLLPYLRRYTGGSPTTATSCPACRPATWASTTCPERRVLAVQPASLRCCVQAGRCRACFQRPRSSLQLPYAVACTHAHSRSPAPSPIAFAGVAGRHPHGPYAGGRVRRQRGGHRLPQLNVPPGPLLLRCGHLPCFVLNYVHEQGADGRFLAWLDCL